MYKTIKVTVCLLCLIASFQIHAQETVKIKELTVEANHSTIQFTVPIANGITKVTGKFKDYTIDLNYVDDDLSKSTISAVIQAKSIDTGISGRDDHLRTSDFFDVEKYPEISFVSKKIEKSDQGYLVTGEFNMHGQQKIIEFPLQITGQLGENTIGFSCRFIIDRTDFDIASDYEHSSIENFLAKEIIVEVDFWTKRKKKK
ncbi:MAG: YceI family protein [Bacteroidia bacterium]|nr:YceI family protein [Bacteroidia bacterium]NND50914.1 YceI family protein [Flavobacteriaceae bacterium]